MIKPKYRSPAYYQDPTNAIVFLAEVIWTLGEEYFRPKEIKKRKINKRK